MRTMRMLACRTALLGAALVLSQLATHAAEPTSPAGLIQVRVTIPATPSPTKEQNVSERFVDALADAFRNWGFSGKVARLDALDKPAPDAAVIAINLTEWNRDRTANINCRFSATLNVNGKKTYLGTFRGMSPGMLTGPGPVGDSDAFDRAAADALRLLYEQLAKTDAIVGLHPR